MRPKVINAIANWKNTLISNYKAIVRVNSSVSNLKLISYERCKETGEVNFVVQVSGKNIFPKLKLADLESHSLLSNFSELDQKIIHNFLSRSQGQPDLRIIARTYDRDKKCFLFTIESRSEEKSFVTGNLSELMKNLHKFDKEDSSLIRLEAENK